jgi:dynein heavy chain, axonemal
MTTIPPAVAQALAKIKEQRAVAATARQKSADLKAGMDIFSIPQPPYKELTAMEADVERLQAIWTIVAEWEASYNTWKQGRFREIKVRWLGWAAAVASLVSLLQHQKMAAGTMDTSLQVNELEEAAARIGKSVQKLGRDIKHWEVWQWIRDRIDTFKRTMPLISDLRNPAMRPRHWKSLVDAIQTAFDPTTDAFTLDSIVALRLDQHAEFIGEMSVNATKELAIEQSLAAIAEAWKVLDLDMVCCRYITQALLHAHACLQCSQPALPLQVDYKSSFKLRSTEDAFAALEDNTVTLSTMKASKFFVVFEAEITTWERTLSVVSEMLEMVLQVLAAMHVCLCVCALHCTTHSLLHTACLTVDFFPAPCWCQCCCISALCHHSKPYLQAHCVCACAGAAHLAVPGEHFCGVRGHSKAAASGERTL